ncbi:vWA domain-containing protein [Pseudooceanicola sp. 200-1SW]|uniref:vWA domain-containing protein n=1 Tax=Pseudooceanicola sp. 200-1SW TaxID=3425949 RepID=UPI003D7F9FEA
MIRLSLTALLLAGALPGALAAQEGAATGRTIIVMDGSGSMWGQIDGRTKLEIARETVADVLADFPPERGLGLVAYGHRTRGDCSDIEVMVPPAPGTAPQVLAAVNAMRFQGKTPLSEAVRQAAQALRFTEDPATVVLVTDGLETCSADPCALGRELEAAGIDFTAHVVGFGLTAEEGAQVACLARETGGRYIEAGNAGALSDALSQTVLASADPAPAPVPAPQPEPPMTLPAASLSAPAPAGAITASYSVTWEGPGAEEDYVDIVPASDPEGRYLSYVNVATGNPAQIRLPVSPGDYLLRYRWTGGKADTTLATLPVTVTDAAFALDAPVAAEQGAVITVFWRGPGGADDYIDTMPQGSTAVSGEVTYRWVRDGNPLELQVPVTPGAYQLRYVVQGPDDRSVGLSLPLEVLPTTASLRAPPAVRPGASFQVRATGPMAFNDWVDLVPTGFAEFSGELSYFYTKDSSAGEGWLYAPDAPGAYEIRYVAESGDGRAVLARIPLTVSAEAPVDVTLPPRTSAPEPATAAPAQTEVIAPEVVLPDPAPLEDSDIKAQVEALRDSAAAEMGLSAEESEAGLGEDVAFLCTGEAGTTCDFTDAQTGLSFTLPGGWAADYPYQEGPGAPVRVHFFEAEAGRGLMLNPPDPNASDLGACLPSPLGPLCMTGAEAMSAISVLMPSLALAE